MFPYSVRWPCRAVRCGRHPDDPAAAFVTVSPRPPPLPAASIVEAYRCVRDAWRDGHPPLRFSACARRDDRWSCDPLSPVVTVRAPARTGHAPPLLHGRCSATRASHRTAWPVTAPLRRPAALLGFLPFAALLPPAGVAAFPPHGPTCRFPGLPVPTRCACYVSSGRTVAVHPLGSKADRTKDSGRGSWASSPRAVRSTTAALPRAAVAVAALGFSSLRSSVVGPRARRAIARRSPCRSWASRACPKT